jgi:hypothetical protein
MLHVAQGFVRTTTAAEEVVQDILLDLAQAPGRGGTSPLRGPLVTQDLDCSAFWSIEPEPAGRASAVVSPLAACAQTGPIRAATYPRLRTPPPGWGPTPPASTRPGRRSTSNWATCCGPRSISCPPANAKSWSFAT